MLTLELIKAAIDREAEAWEDTGDHPITASVRELARRVRVEMLRAGGREWADDEVAIFGGNLNGTGRHCELRHYRPSSTVEGLLLSGLPRSRDPC